MLELRQVPKFHFPCLLSHVPSTCSPKSCPTLLLPICLHIHFRSRPLLADRIHGPFDLHLLSLSIIGSLQVNRKLRLSLKHHLIETRQRSQLCPLSLHSRPEIVTVRPLQFARGNRKAPTLRLLLLRPGCSIHPEELCNLVRRPQSPVNRVRMSNGRLKFLTNLSLTQTLLVIDACQRPESALGLDEDLSGIPAATHVLEASRRTSSTRRHPRTRLTCRIWKFHRNMTRDPVERLETNPSSSRFIFCHWFEVVTCLF